MKFHLKDFAEEIIKLTGTYSKDRLQTVANRRSETTTTGYY